MRKYLLLLVIGCCAGAFGGELALRLAGYPVPRLLEVKLPADALSRPHASYRYEGYLAGTFIDFSNLVTLNSDGFHDVEHSALRARPDTCRIMVLGDSYVAALSIPLAHTFPRQIEQRLQLLDPLGHGAYEVIALGRGNQAQETQLRWLRTYGPRYQPDLVLLAFFCGNDFMENSSELFAEARAFATFYQQIVAPRKAACFKRLMLIPTSRLNGLLAEYLTTWYAAHLDRFDHGLQAADLVSPEMGIYQRQPAPAWQRARQRTEDLLDAIQAECGQQGAPLTMVVLAGPQAVGEVGGDAWFHSDRAGLDRDQPERWVSAWCDQHAVPHLSLTPVLQRAGVRRVYWRHDGHLTPYGNSVVADALAPFVANILTAPASPRFNGIPYRGKPPPVPLPQAPCP